MDDVFALPVSYGGKELEFPLQIVATGYALRYLVDVDGLELIYEYDDAGELRATVRNPDDDVDAQAPEPGLLQAIGDVLQGLKG